MFDFFMVAPLSNIYNAGADLNFVIDVTGYFK